MGWACAAARRPPSSSVGRAPPQAPTDSASGRTPVPSVGRGGGPPRRPRRGQPARQWAELTRAPSAWSQVAYCSPVLTAPARSSRSPTTSLQGIPFQRPWESQVSGDLNVHAGASPLPATCSVLQLLGPCQGGAHSGPSLGTAWPRRATRLALAPSCPLSLWTPGDPSLPLQEGLPIPSSHHSQDSASAPSHPRALATVLAQAPSQLPFPAPPGASPSPFSRGPLTQPRCPGLSHVLSAAGPTGAWPHLLSEPPSDSAVQLFPGPPSPERAPTFCSDSTSPSLEGLPGPPAHLPSHVLRGLQALTSWVP